MHTEQCITCITMQRVYTVNVVTIDIKYRFLFTIFKIAYLDLDVQQKIILFWLGSELYLNIKVLIKYING